MRIINRLSRLEQQYPKDAPPYDGYAARWSDAYCEIAETMDAHDFAGVHSEIVAFLKSVRESGVSYWSSGGVMSFVAARVFSLIDRAASSFPVGLLMPPALAAVWREHDQRHADDPPSERHIASFDSQACFECGAEHPWLGRYELSEAENKYVVVNESELIKACLSCGGLVGSASKAQGRIGV